MTVLKDPLLAIAKGLLTFFITVLGLVAALLAAVAVMMPFVPDRAIARIAEDGGAVATAGDIYLLAATLLVAAVLVAMIVYILVNLWRIVRSVGEGDPFIPANAERLSRMGWTLLAYHVVGVVMNVLVREIQSVFAEAEIGFDGSIDGGSLMLMLTIFILARVFRHGTAMREDLEGTV